MSLDLSGQGLAALRRRRRRVDRPQRRGRSAAAAAVPGDDAFGVSNLGPGQRSRPT